MLFRSVRDVHAVDVDRARIGGDDAGDHPQLRLQHLIGLVQQALLGNALFKAAAMPKSFVKILVSRYQPGMSYGAHVDDALMGGVRTDLSFTLFLSDPETYGGGALVIEDCDRARGHEDALFHLLNAARERKAFVDLPSFVAGANEKQPGEPN